MNQKYLKEDIKQTIKTYPFTEINKIEIDNLRYFII